jgi:hypothetical protein
VTNKYAKENIRKFHLIEIITFLFENVKSKNWEKMLLKINEIATLTFAKMHYLFYGCILVLFNLTHSKVPNNVIKSDYQN